jgi:hypothetical protein
MGELAHRSGGERRTRAQLTGLERRMGDLPEQLAASVQPHLNDAAEQTRDLAFAITLDPDRPGRDRLLHEAGELRALRHTADERQGLSEHGQKKLNLNNVFAPALPPSRKCDRCIAEGITGICLHMLPRKAVAAPPLLGLRPAAAVETDGPFAPRHSTALALPATTVAVTTTGATEIAAAASGGAIDNTLQVQVVALQAQIVALQAQLAEKGCQRKGDELSETQVVSKSMPVGLDVLKSNWQLYRVWASTIAPQERLGPSHAPKWRRTETLGDRRTMKSVGYLVNDIYCPVMLNVMKRACADQMSEVPSMPSAERLTTIVQDMEKERAGRKWKEEYIGTLPKIDKKDEGAHFYKLLLDPSLPAISRPSEGASACAASGSRSADQEEVAAEVSPLVAATEGATRYLAIDPSLTCGWALIDVKDERVVAISVGVIDVSKIDDCFGMHVHSTQLDSSDKDGARCNALVQQLQPLLTPPPEHVFIEGYSINPKALQGVETNFAVRAAAPQL